MSRPATYPDLGRGGGMRRVLVVSVDPEERRALREVLRRSNFDVVEANGAAEAIARLEADDCDVVITADRLRQDSGLDLLASARRRWPRAARVLVTDDMSLAPTAINHAGVGYLLPTTWDRTSLTAALEATGPASCARAGRIAPTAQSSPLFPDIVRASRAMQEVLSLAWSIAQTDSTVLVTGETGTGKDLIGRAIHDASRRRDRGFTAVNAAGFPESLLDSELFGHQRGSFTGANANTKGLFENAHEGTVFLDEVAEMPLSMQAKLLRFFQTGEVRPIGSHSTRLVDVRLVAATNKDLVEEVARGNFREDLYYRLAVIPLHVPPLRERIEDISVLARHFLARLAKRSGRPIEILEPSAIGVLQAHDWPGNVRELENVIECAVALSRDGRIDASDLPCFRRPRTGARNDTQVESLPVLERRHIIATLDRVGWNRKRAAGLLQISTTTLWRRLKEFEVDGTHSRKRAMRETPEAPCAAGT